MKVKKVVILGGGISGLACDFFLNAQENINVIGFEKNSYFGGHAHSWSENGNFWDEGPHVFFGLKNDVEPFFDFSNDSEINATVLNFADGNWINQPVYVNLVDLPKHEGELLKNSLINAPAQSINSKPNFSNYKNWLIDTYGKSYAEKFPVRYNEKYWRSDLSFLSTDWIDSRMFKPSIDQILDGFETRQQLHYINKFRYPVGNGYSSYFKKAIFQSRIRSDTEVKKINLKAKTIENNSGTFEYDFLINTIPLKTFISLCTDVPAHVLEATKNLKHTSMLVINLKFSGIVDPFFHWAYIHDSDLLSTRVTNYSNLNRSYDHKIKKNSDISETRIQVEVYESITQPFHDSHSDIAKKVVEELKSIGIIPKNTNVDWSTQYAFMANVVFNLERNSSLGVIYEYLETFGLSREQNEFSANLKNSEIDLFLTGNIFLVGRFAQWNYYWTHDCVKRARIVVNQIINQVKD